MNTSTTKPTITKKYHIEVPTDTYTGSPACVYKVWFGKAYLIWKGKRLLQSADALAESIERYLRRDDNIPGSWIYHVCNYIRKTRCQRAKIEMVDCDFIPAGKVTAIDVYRMLKLEQSLLKEAHGDPLCLNNNEQAYISKWMEDARPDDVDKFLRTWDK